MDLNKQIASLPTEISYIIWRTYWHKYVRLELKTIVNTRLLYSVGRDSKYWIPDGDSCAEDYYDIFHHINKISDRDSKDDYEMDLEDMPSPFMMAIIIFQVESCMPYDYTHNCPDLEAKIANNRKVIISKTLGRKIDIQMELQVYHINKNRGVYEYENKVVNIYNKIREKLGIRKLFYSYEEYINAWQSIGATTKNYKVPELGYRADYIF